MKLHALTTGALLLAAMALPACARQTPPTVISDAAAKPSATAATVKPAATADDAVPQLERMVVHKSEFCGCCRLWVEHMRDAGFQVEVRNVDNLNPIKQQVGVPLAKGSCHTAQVGNYFIEGHVPAADVKRLLAEKPDAKGLVVPGMPLGSPGMEVPDGTVHPYTVELVGRDGTTTPFAQHGPTGE